MNIKKMNKKELKKKISEISDIIDYCRKNKWYATSNGEKNWLLYHKSIIQLKLNEKSKKYSLIYRNNED